MAVTPITWVARPRASGDGRGRHPDHALRKLRDVPPTDELSFEKESSDA